MNGTPLYLVLFAVFCLSMFVDFKGHKGHEEQSMRTSILWTVFWIAMGLGVGGFIYLWYGASNAMEYFTGYAMEKCLSIDNLMVFMAIFSYFGLNDSWRQHKVLTWGIIGALVFRAIFASAGSALFHLNGVVQAAFGGIVIWSAKSIVFGDDNAEVDYEKTWYVRLIKKIYPVDTRDGFTGFFSSVGGLRHVTPLLFCAVAIEFSDVMFSFDSVPAVIGVAKETPIIYAAMVMAILGLRALYFVLGSLMKHLHHLEKAVALILVFVGSKLIAAPLGFDLDPVYSLVVVLGLLATGVLASLAFPKEE